eukprot:Ihof_evm4s73 gene=Ihof_evmTU4s73
MRSRLSAGDKDPFCWSIKKKLPSISRRLLFRIIPLIVIGVFLLFIVDDIFPAIKIMPQSGNIKHLWYENRKIVLAAPIFQRTPNKSSWILQRMMDKMVIGSNETSENPDYFTEAWRQVYLGKVPSSVNIEELMEKYSDELMNQQSTDTLRNETQTVAVVVDIQNIDRGVKVLNAIMNQSVSINMVLVTAFTNPDEAFQKKVEQLVKQLRINFAMEDKIHFVINTRELNQDAMHTMGLQTGAQFVAFVDGTYLPSTHYLEYLVAGFTTGGLFGVVGSSAITMPCDQFPEHFFCSEKTRDGPGLQMLQGIYMVEASVVKLAFRLKNPPPGAIGINRLCLGAWLYGGLPSTVAQDPLGETLVTPPIINTQSLSYLEVVARQGALPFGYAGHSTAHTLVFVDTNTHAAFVRQYLSTINPEIRKGCVVVLSGRDDSIAEKMRMDLAHLPKLSDIYNLRVGEAFSRAERFVDVVYDTVMGVQSVLYATNAKRVTVVADGNPASFAAALAARLNGVEVEGIRTKFKPESSLLLSLTTSLVGSWKNDLRPMTDVASRMPIAGDDDTEDEMLCSNAYANYLRLSALDVGYAEASDILSEPAVYKRKGVSPGRKPSVTILMTVFRRPDEFNKVLSLLLQQTANVTEIWVNALGGPMVGEFERLAKLAAQNDSRVKFFGSSKNLGYFGRLQLAQVAESDYIISMDDDLTPGPRYVEVMVHAMSTTKYRATLGCRGAQYTQCDWMENNTPVICSQIDTHGDYHEVDALFSTQFLETAQAALLFREEPVTFLTAEDMHISYSLHKYASFRSLKFYSSYDPDTRGWSDKTIMESNRSWKDSKELVYIDPKSPIEISPEKRNHNLLRNMVLHTLYSRGNRAVQSQKWNHWCKRIYFVDTVDQAYVVSSHFSAEWHNGSRGSIAVAVSGRLGHSSKDVLEALGVDRKAWVEHLQADIFDLAVGQHFRRNERFTDVLLDTMLSLHPVMENLLPKE